MDYDTYEGGADPKIVAAVFVGVTILTILIIIFFVMKSVNKAVNSVNTNSGAVSSLNSAIIAAVATGGRYVRLERVENAVNYSTDPMQNAINVTGINVYDSSDNLISSGVPVTSGSMLMNYYPGNVVDGDVKTMFHSMGGLDYSTIWVQLDLGSDKHIKSIAILNRTDCCTNRLTGCRVRVIDSAGVDVYVSDVIKTIGPLMTFTPDL